MVMNQNRIFPLWIINTVKPLLQTINEEGAQPKETSSSKIAPPFIPPVGVIRQSELDMDLDESHSKLTPQS